MSNDIVQINVSQQVGATSSTLQQTGACISNGATTLAEGTTALITQTSDLTPLLVAPQALTSLTWLSSVVTGTTTTPHGYTTGQSIYLTIAGAAPAGYNGTFLASITGASTFTYPLTTNPGTETTPGTVISGSVAELTSMIDTFFANGSTVSVNVLEVGAVSSTVGIANFDTWLTANLNKIYLALLPRSWAADSTLLPLGKLYSSTTSKFYMLTTCSMADYAEYAATKCFVTAVEAAGVATPPSTEFDLASFMWNVLNQNPSTTNKVPPMAFRFVSGVTGSNFTGPQQSALKAGFCNYFITGAEGGISNIITKWGTTADGRDFTYWYAVDWLQINIALALSNEIINGSNNPINPLGYNQNGINRLQLRAQQTTNSGITYALILSPATVQAVPFAQYVVDNPNDYLEGIYNGFSLVMTPQIGFKSITFNISVTDFITS